MHKNKYTHARMITQSPLPVSNSREWFLKFPLYSIFFRNTPGIRHWKRLTVLSHIVPPGVAIVHLHLFSFTGELILHWLNSPRIAISANCKYVYHATQKSPPPKKTIMKIKRMNRNHGKKGFYSSTLLLTLYAIGKQMFDLCCYNSFYKKSFCGLNICVPSATTTHTHSFVEALILNRGIWGRG